MPRSTVLSKGYLKKKTFKNAIIFFLLALVLLTSVIFITLHSKAPYENEYDGIISENAEKYGLQRALVYAVIECESGFDKDAVSSAGACGLMQLMPDTFEWIFSGTEKNGSADIFDPRQNVEAGCKYLSYLIKRFENVETALAAYNAGEGTVSTWLKGEKYSEDGKALSVIPYSETRLYVGRVMRRLAEYEKAEIR